ncbi:hypothetical protein [Paenibacillus sp. VMFN-D1]|uniref:hypothetical protein n=1 Tax=Paenibacillus sp. VMFN-D1 TaxID=2135608 RepID=UPI000E237A9A|nr:hypothetical protein [Paenibacillus sp. VMFN-D1]RED34665.1 hypothetical protein C7820_4328 [Paenibacillus sp. VMFN-D1]
MVILAELNENNVCVGVKMVGEMIDDGKHVEIDKMDFELYSYRKYENGEWSEEKFLPDYAQIELDRMEKIEKSQADQDELIMQIMLGGA